MQPLVFLAYNIGNKLTATKNAFKLNMLHKSKFVLGETL